MILPVPKLPRCQTCGGSLSGNESVFRLEVKSGEPLLYHQDQDACRKIAAERDSALAALDRRLARQTGDGPKEFCTRAYYGTVDCSCSRHLGQPPPVRNSDAFGYRR